MNVVFLSFLVYLVVVAFVGAWAVRFSSKDLGEYFLAGRRLGYLTVALSAVASGRSAWLIVGVTGLAYKRGLSALWAIVGYSVVETLLFLYVAPKIRNISEETNSITVPDLFNVFSGRVGRWARIISSIIILIFLTTYISAQLLAGGKTFNATFGTGLVSGMIYTSLIILFYTVLGGFLAVSITDVIQAVFMLIALIILPIVAIHDAGGLFALKDVVSYSVRLAQGHTVINPDTFFDPLSLSFGSLIGFIGIGLGSPGSPHIIVRYMSAKNDSLMKPAAYISLFWNIVMGIGAVMIGVVGRAFFATPDRLPSGDVENLFATLAQIHLHPVLYGATIAAVFAAIMSTVDSMLLVVSSTIINDIYYKLFNKDPKKEAKRSVLLSRVAVFCVTIIALLGATRAKEVVFWFVLFSWSGLGAAFGPPILLSLFWKRTSGAGVIAGMITGTVVTVIWKTTPFLKSMIYELIPAFIVSFVVVILFSLLTTKKESD